MMILSAREFRENQTRVLSAALSGQSIILTSRLGNFKITPVTDDDRILERDLRMSLSEVERHMKGELNLPNAKDVVF